LGVTAVSFGAAVDPFLAAAAVAFLLFAAAPAVFLSAAAAAAAYATALSARVFRAIEKRRKFCVSMSVSFFSLDFNFSDF
jgi:hypothetical protein